MVKLDISLWNNPERMRERIRNLGTIIMSLTATNGFYDIYIKNWFLLGLNLLFFITILPLFMSYSKWRKEPPIQEREDV